MASPDGIHHPAYPVAEKTKKMHVATIIIINTPQTYLLIVHVSIGCVSITHDLPEEHSKAPNITAGGELPTVEGFRRCPTERKLQTL